MAKSLSHRYQRGAAAVEMGLFLPVLIVILFGIIDFSRAIHFDNILIHTSREGANLAARTPAGNEQGIISALTQTADPLDISTQGMIHITRVVGLADGTARVTDQFRSAQGVTSLESRLFVCGAWDADNSCQIPQDAGPIIDLGTPLALGEPVSIVESQYDFQLLTGFIFNASPELYSRTIL